MSGATPPPAVTVGAAPLVGEGFVLRPWRPGDEDALIRHADDRGVWRNLTDHFPHPYTREAAYLWIASQLEAEQKGALCNLAIEVGGEACGGIGIQPFTDLACKGAEIGYWLGRSHWGAGIATRALRLLTAHVFSTTDRERLQATVLAWNPASCRVAEKAGYQCEGTLRNSIFKDGELIDSYLYARIRADG